MRLSPFTGAGPLAYRKQEPICTIKGDVAFWPSFAVTALRQSSLLTEADRPSVSRSGDVKNDPLQKSGWQAR